MNYIVSAVSNILNFERYFIENPCLREGWHFHPIINKRHEPHGSLYNSFLNALPDDAEWVIFSHDTLEFMDNPLHALQGLPQDSLYGALGARIAYNADAVPLIECWGKIVECASDSPSRVLGNAFRHLEKLPEVDSLDSVCLIVHAQVIREHDLRFDGILRVLYGENFCLHAFDAYGISSRIAALELHLHASIFPLDEDLQQDAAMLAQRYVNTRPRACVHKAFGVGEADVARILLMDKLEKGDTKLYVRKPYNFDNNLPIIVASHMFISGRRVLDCGCANGDNGVFLKQNKQSELYGMEYNPISIEFARAQNIYNALHHVDFNTFEPNDYASYYHFFDNILLMDVLEHLYSPKKVMQRLSLFLRENGSFIISVPNLAHAYPVLSLVNKEFRYRDFGILDSTHIRFFTWKSLAISLASWGFSVERSSAVFRAPNTANSNAPISSLPMNVIEALMEDPHSLACQYVCRVRPSTAPYAELKKRNLASLENAVHANPKGRQDIDDYMREFRQKLIRGAGVKFPPGAVKQLQDMISQGDYAEAIIAAGFFDEEWYRDTYDEVDFTEQHPLEHYVLQGWKEGKNPCESFNTLWYLERYKDIIPDDMCPLLFHVIHGVTTELPYNQACLAVLDTDMVRYAEHVIHQECDYRNTFVEIDSEPFVPDSTDPRLLAFYLPQFAPFPENDRWWGKGFTEWTNVTKATPLYPGHYQPHLPYDLGLYDLRVKETCLRQEELAKLYGVHGFCYHYYWFDGTKIMNGPIEEKLRDSALDLPFCISWANEAWSANWDGSQNNLLIGQPQHIQTECLFYTLLPFFTDARYIRVNGKPFFMMYRPSYFTEETIRDFIADFRALAVKNGLPGLHMTLGTTLPLARPLVPLHNYGADAYVEFPPHRFTRQKMFGQRLCNTRSMADIYDLTKMIEAYKAQPPFTDKTYRTVFPMWDNTARRAESGAVIFKNASPDVYYDWLSWSLSAMEREADTPDNRLIFINAWNEWAEGAHLEPDRKYGYAFLQATKQALYGARRQ